MALFVARGLQHSWLRRRITRRFKGLCGAICNLAVSDVQFWSQTVPFGQDQYRPFLWAARIIRWGAFALGVLSSNVAVAQESDFLETLLKDTSNVMIVLDGSGSMNQDWRDGATKFEAARDGQRAQARQAGRSQCAARPALLCLPGAVHRSQPPSSRCGRTQTRYYAKGAARPAVPRLADRTPRRCCHHAVQWLTTRPCRGG